VQVSPDVIQAQVIAARVVGTVTQARGDRTAPLKDNDSIAMGATVKTAAGSSIVLLFSNGASVRLGPETELVVEQFLQDPFSARVNLATLAEEPTVSRTHLRLVRGEIVGHVKGLKRAQGSSFSVRTPVGVMRFPADGESPIQGVGGAQVVRTTMPMSVEAATAIRQAPGAEAPHGWTGGTFRIFFRPLTDGTGAKFSLASAAGSVAFASPNGGREIQVTPGNELTVSAEVSRK